MTDFVGQAYNISLADLIAQNLFGATNINAPTHQRIPFIFTSDYLLYQTGFTGVKDVAATATALGVTDPQAIQEQTSNVRDSISIWPSSNNVSSSQSVPTGMVADDSAMIAMAINPQSIRWDQPKRFVKKDTQTGALFLFFADNAGENNDILTLTINGTSGNIDTRAFANIDKSAQAYATQNAKKLITWHKLYQLTRQPMFYTVSSEGVSYQNNFYIIYRTLLMPFELRLTGFFSKVLEFTENAADPFKRDFSMQFTVTSTNPPLSDLVRFLTSGRPSPVGQNSPGAATAPIAPDSAGGPY